MSDSFSFSGREIRKKLDPELGNKLDIYRVQMHQVDNLEEDKKANCKDYEKDTNQSYKTCVEMVVEICFIKKFGCMPPCFSENVCNFCSETYTMEQWKSMSDYILSTIDYTFLQVSTF